jgi:uncharacterized protein with ParB-like and HNH nuclease domain
MAEDKIIVVTGGGGDNGKKPLLIYLAVTLLLCIASFFTAHYLHVKTDVFSEVKKDTEIVLEESGRIKVKIDRIEADRNLTIEEIRILKTKIDSLHTIMDTSADSSCEMSIQEVREAMRILGN